MVERNEENLSPREAIAERWKNARPILYRYPAGKVTDSNGFVLRQSQGVRLLILGEEVMDNCQRPWTNATVDNAFSILDLNRKRSRNPKGTYDVQVLERGFGLGMIASRIMIYLHQRGGSYTSIELNEKTARYVDTTWRNNQDEIARLKATSIMGSSARDAKYIPMTVIRGDAFEETAKLAQEGKKFDIIISDTYPLTEEEKSVNDLLDLEQLIKCLNPDGVFAFFGFHTGSDGGMNVKQRNMIDRYFDDARTTWVRVSPPPDYKYFNPESGPVRRLPVIICSMPRIQSAA